MDSQPNYDCIVIGHNELPIKDYERLVRAYGLQSPTYRDLRMSFVNVAGCPRTYLDLLNDAYETCELLSGQRPLPFISGDIPHLAAVYLASHLCKRQHRATFISLFQNEKETLRSLLLANPLCVAITTTLYTLNVPAKEVVDFVRSCNPEVKIIIGGPLIANHARIYRDPARGGQNAVTIGGLHEMSTFETVLDDIGADVYVIEAQGEQTLHQLVQCLRRGEDLDNVPNIVYFDGNRYRYTAMETEDNDLDEGDIDWRALLNGRLAPTIQTRTARSCAFKCSFCNYPTRAGKLSLASINTVIRELDSMRDLGAVENLVFIDDTFNVPLERFKSLCRAMIERKYGFHVFSYLRCSNADDESVELMARAGWTGVFLGIESGAPVILENMNKAASVEKYVRGIKLLREQGITTFASFIIGFPGETAATVDETMEFIRQNQPDFYRAQLWYCEPGTPIQLQRTRFRITGEGFNWSHASMNSREAMTHIEEMFLRIRESQWLPQWSCDFWSLPYLLGRDIGMRQIRQFIFVANRMLALEIGGVSGLKREVLQQEYLTELRNCVRSWEPQKSFSSRLVQTSLS